MTQSNGDVNRYCGKCGAPLPAGDLFCPKCGTAVASSAQPTVRTSTAPQQLDWREQRRQMRAERREERYNRPGPHIGGLIIATILIVAGLGIFFPQLPWQAFWGSLLIIMGFWIVYLWATRSSRNASTQQNPGNSS
jgi:zinc-ribbon domain